MSRPIPAAVVAAITAAICAHLQVEPSDIRLHLRGPAPPDDARGHWQLGGILAQMEDRRR